MLTMFDSINVKEIPGGAAASAGYVDGRWPTFPQLRTPHRLSIAVFARDDADCLDVENGDSTVGEAGAWVKRQQARGVRLPVVYTSVSQARALLAALAAEGVQRSDIRLWTAHYTFVPHICSPACGFGFTGKADGTQYTDHAFGRNLDASLVADYFFAPAASSVDPRPEPKNQAPFTRAVWPRPVPQWFWAWAEWRLDGQITMRPVDAPAFIPPWAWARLAAL